MKDIDVTRLRGDMSARLQAIVETKNTTFDEFQAWLDIERERCTAVLKRFSAHVTKTTNGESDGGDVMCLACCGKCVLKEGWASYNSQDYNIGSLPTTARSVVDLLAFAEDCIRHCTEIVEEYGLSEVGVGSVNDELPAKIASLLSSCEDVMDSVQHTRGRLLAGELTVTCMEGDVVGCGEGETKKGREEADIPIGACSKNGATLGKDSPAPHTEPAIQSNVNGVETCAMETQDIVKGIAVVSNEGISAGANTTDCAVVLAAICEQTANMMTDGEASENDAGCVVADENVVRTSVGTLFPYDINWVPGRLQPGIVGGAPCFAFKVNGEWVPYHAPKATSWRGVTLSIIFDRVLRLNDEHRDDAEEEDEEEYEGSDVEVSGSDVSSDEEDDDNDVYYDLKTACGQVTKGWAHAILRSLKVVGKKDKCRKKSRAKKKQSKEHRRSGAGPSAKTEHKRSRKSGSKVVVPSSAREISTLKERNESPPSTPVRGKRGSGAKNRPPRAPEKRSRDDRSATTHRRRKKRISYKDDRTVETIDLRGSDDRHSGPQVEEEEEHDRSAPEKSDGAEDEGPGNEGDDRDSSRRESQDTDEDDDSDGKSASERTGEDQSAASERGGSPFPSRTLRREGERQARNDSDTEERVGDRQIVQHVSAAEKGRRHLITQELIAPIVQLADDLSPDIYFQSDDSPAPHIFERSLDPYLQWTVCLEEPRDEDTLPSRQEYLKPYEIIPHAFYSRAEEVVIDNDEEEEDDDEETSEEGSYSEHSEGELSKGEEEEEETGSEWEALLKEATRTGTEAEDPEEARKREEIATGKRHLKYRATETEPIPLLLQPHPSPSSPTYRCGR
ncbi:hypothetical protein CBR_g418 [Chara braunii]|uniref:Uncharacterized protein n=1 Tax=Chara braunii TaxID=69332 RepID=A0A388JQN2_CHABU|nr:hypothetical protein CBR_g418 [Chara braunii]|eukprot:GBG60087.1 hypothetical protein CBR_g418 [Chara braunii]